MSLCGKLVSELPINASAEKCYKIFKDNCKHMPNITPKFIQQVDVHDGDWDTHGHGSIKIWNYFADGKPEVLKEQVEYDDAKLKITMRGIEGSPFRDYKFFKPIFQYVPKSDNPNHCLAILTIEYEKLNDSSPYPYKYIEIMNGITKDMESNPSF
ncbi:hypothetical protein IC575_024778 [Cucumis melo]